MVNDSYFRFDDDNKIKYTFSRSSLENWESGRDTAPYIEQKIIERIVLILETDSAAYIWLSILVVQSLQISLNNDDEMV